METNIRKLIVEQITYPQCNPIDPGVDFTDEEWTGSGRPPVRSGCAPCKKGNKIFIRCRASVTPVIDDKYVGVYVKKGLGIIGDFKVRFKQFRNQLKMTMGGGQYVLTKSTNTEDVFWNQTFGIDVTFDSTEDPPQAIINLSTPNASVLTTLEGANVVRLMAPPPVGQGSEIIVTKTDESVNPAAEDSAVWDCIKTAVDKMNGIMMGTSLRGDYKYLPVDTVYEGEDTDFYFYKNYKAEWKTSDSLKVIKTGKWECTENGEGFQITWDDGKIEKFPKRVRLGDNQNNNQDNQNGEGDNVQPPSNIKPCTSYSNEPKESDVLKGKKVIKKCMKGPIIEKIQKMPVFQSYLFDVLRGNRKPEVTDNLFGPYMEKAIKIYQSTNGIYSLNVTQSGKIDKVTYELLLKQNENRPGPGPEPPKPPKPTPTPSPAPEPPKPQFSNQKTKF